MQPQSKDATRTRPPQRVGRGPSRTIALTGALCWYRQCWQPVGEHRPVAPDSEHWRSLLRQTRELARMPR